MIEPLSTEKMKDLGEKGFLQTILPTIYTDPRLVGGFGHDSAVIELPNAPFNLIQKVDRASHPVSVKKGWSDYRTWGQMAVTANCSDILASGGTPIACMLAIIIPGTELAVNVTDIIRGAADECRRHGVVYAGGDTKEGSGGNVIGTTVGTIPKDGFLPRNTAKPGDQLYCAGLIGGFVGAYFMLEDVLNDHETAEARKYIEYLSTPVAQWAVAGKVNSERLAHTGMDASDGLLDVFQTFASAGVRIEINLEEIPYHEFALTCAQRTRIPLTQFIFGGGDWNILYCVSPESVHRAESLRKAGLPLFHVGQIVGSNGVFAVDKNGRKFSIEGSINEHFANRIEDAGSFMDLLKNGNYLHAL